MDRWLKRLGMIGGGIAAHLLLVGCTVTPGGSDDGTGGNPSGSTEPTIVTVAGTGLAGNNGDGSDALDTQFYFPVDMDFSPLDAKLYIVDWNNHRIRRINTDNTVETITGTGELTGDLQEEGPAKESKLNHPTNIYFEDNGDMLIAAWHNSQLTRTTLSVESSGETVMNNVFAGVGGRSFGGDNGPAMQAKLNLPSSMVEDSAGNIIFTDQANQRIRRIDAVTTNVETICNDTGTGGYNGDNIPALGATIKLPAGQSSAPSGRICIDQFDNIYLADTENHRIRMIDSVGMITTVVGTGTAGYSGDGGPATLAELNTPSDVAIADDGTLYIADTYNNAIRMVSPAGVITTLAGNGEAPTDSDGDGYLHANEIGDGGPAKQAKLSRPFGVAIAPNGEIYVADTYNGRIRRITNSDVDVVDHGDGFIPDDQLLIKPCDEDTIGSICTYVGTGEKGFDGDGKDRTVSTIYWPLDIEFTPSGKTYVIDWNNHKLREILADGTMITRIGGHFIGDGAPDFSDLYTIAGDPLGVDVNLNHIGDLLELPNGDLVVTVWHNHKVRLYQPATETVRVVIGDNPANYEPGVTDDVEGYKARLNLPSHSVLDSKGNLIIIDQKNWLFRVAENFAEDLELAHVRTIAGITNKTMPTDGHDNYVEGTPLSEATFGWPGGPNPEPAGGLVIDPNNDLVFYFAENESSTIWKLEYFDEQWSDGTITRVAGTGVEGYADGPALEAQFNWPQDMEMGPDGNLYLADTNNFRVRMIDLTTGMVSTVAGNGNQSVDANDDHIVDSNENGDGGLAIDANFDRAFGIAFDLVEGDLYISDTFNGRIRKINLNLGQ